MFNVMNGIVVFECVITLIYASIAIYGVGRLFFMLELSRQRVIVIKSFLNEIEYGERKKLSNKKIKKNMEKGFIVASNRFGIVKKYHKNLASLYGFYYNMCVSGVYFKKHDKELVDFFFKHEKRCRKLFEMICKEETCETTERFVEIRKPAMDIIIAVIKWLAGVIGTKIIDLILKFKN